MVASDTWQKQASKGVRYVQGYFTTDDSCSIRVRIAGDSAELNIKNATLGISRTEYNYPIPLNDAEEMLQNLCIHPLIEKTRYLVPDKKCTWEVDVFSGENDGLVVAEIELDSMEQAFAKPDWVGKEVSDDPRYYNVCLVEHPYKDW